MINLSASATLKVMNTGVFVMYGVAEYLVDIDREFKTGVAKEHSYRPALKKLFEFKD